MCKMGKERVAAEIVNQKSSLSERRKERKARGRLNDSNTDSRHVFPAREDAESISYAAVSTLTGKASLIRRYYISIIEIN